MEIVQPLAPLRPLAVVPLRVHRPQEAVLLLLVLGWKARWAAAVLFVFTALAALLFHNFWTVPADQAQIQMIMFMKNIAIMGGLLFVVLHGSGKLSLGKD